MFLPFADVLPSSGLSIFSLIERSNKIGIGKLRQLLQFFAGILQFQYSLCVLGQDGFL